jgi:hypothetical protein
LPSLRSKGRSAGEVRPHKKSKRLSIGALPVRSPGEGDFDDDFGKFMTEVFDRADAFLLGRGTYQIFEGYWPKQTDPKDPIASRLNGLPKHVASRTLERVTWNGSSLTKDMANDVPAIKRKYAREFSRWCSAKASACSAAVRCRRRIG